MAIHINSHTQCLNAVTALLVCVLSGPAIAAEGTGIIQQILNPPQSELQIETAGDDGPLTIEEIVNPTIFSASNTGESALTAPAWVITITGDQLRERGYVELSQIFDDLPGIDVARPYGASWFRPYWRGKRGSWGDDFLFMIDGLPWHDHVYNNARMMIPISYIERVEIVYGPGSLMHGSNAIMGTVNVTTKQDHHEYGSRMSSVVGIHAPQSMLPYAKRLRYVTDLSLFHKSDDFRLSLTGRFDHGFVDESVSEYYEWSKNTYYADSSLWGTDLVENYPQLGGQFRSPYQNMSFDLRLATESIEVGLQYFHFSRGTGLQFAADRYQNQAQWADTFYGAHVRYTKTYDRLETKFLARFKASVWPESNSLLFRSGGAAKLKHYKSDNHGFEVNQLLTYQVPPFFGNNHMVILGGFNYNIDTVARQWVTKSSSVDEFGRLSFDTTGLGEITPDNKLYNHLLAGYLLLKYNFLEDHFLDLGIRQTFVRDDLVSSFRVAYVLKFWEQFTFKFLVGRSFSRPTQRQLTFGGGGIGPNPDLKSEKSTTLELGLNYNSDNLNIQLSPYLIWNKDVMATTADPDGSGEIFANTSDQEILGIDLAAVGSFEVPMLKEFKLWAYLTWYPLTLKNPHSAECSDKDYGDYFVEGVMGHNRTDRECWIGDIASLQIKGGVTVRPVNKVVITALARFVNKRITVETNEKVDKIAPYVTVDATVMLKDLIVTGLHMSLTVANILDTRYAHPGLNSANAGTAPGTWSEDQTTWTGSEGGYNSLMPQPGRSFQLLLSTDFD